MTIQELEVELKHAEKALDRILPAWKGRTRAENLASLLNTRHHCPHWPLQEALCFVVMAHRLMDQEAAKIQQLRNDAEEQSNQ